MVNKITNIFNAEFGIINEKFVFLQMKITEANESTQDFVLHPGVYVFWEGNKIIKVGRSLENSRKRALEHIRDNTRNLSLNMGDEKFQKKGNLFLINCIIPEDLHWVAAIEIYLEKQLYPEIQSKRLG
jgi:hypothetical protein